MSGSGWRVFSCGRNFWGQLGADVALRAPDDGSGAPGTASDDGTGGGDDRPDASTTWMPIDVVAPGEGADAADDDDGDGDLTRARLASASSAGSGSAGDGAPLRAGAFGDVVAGTHWSAATTARGQLMAWGTLFDAPCAEPAPVLLPRAGKGGADELGFVPKTASARDEALHIGGVPLPVVSPRLRVVQVVAGRKHSMCLAASGEVFSWGCGDYGRLGHGVEKHEGKPRLIEALRPRAKDEYSQVKRLGAGGAHSAAILESGVVLMWGANSHSQCGGRPTRARVLPAALHSPASEGMVPVEVTGGAQHSVMLTQDGQVLTWGRSDAGRLGHTASDKQSGAPVRMPKRLQPFRHAPAAMVACGEAHTLAVTRDGVCYSWGRGTEGQCGTGKLFHVRFPRPVQALTPSVIGVRVTWVAAGASSSFAVTARGDLYAWGSNDGGLGFGDPDDWRRTKEARWEAEAADAAYGRPLPRADAGDLRDPSGGSAALPTVMLEGTAGGSRARAVRTFLAGDCVLYPTRVDEPFDMLKVRVVRVAAGACHALALTRPRRAVDDAAAEAAAVAEAHAPAVPPSPDGGASERTDYGGGAVAWDGNVSVRSVREVLSVRSASTGEARAEVAATAAAVGAAREAAREGHGEWALAATGGAGGASGGLVRSGDGDEVYEGGNDWAPLVPAVEPDHAASQSQLALDTANLLRFCRHGRVRDVEDMLMAGMRTDCCDAHGNSTLHVAVQSDQRRVMRLLLDHGADPNAQNKRGQTPLHYAYKYRFDEAIKLLMERGADDTITNWAGLTCYEGLTMEDLERL